MKHETKKKSSRKSNTDRLSQGKKIAAAKKLMKSKRAEECTFDPAARAEFLTGFHKRKLERRSKAHQKNQETERADKLAMRADLRRQRKEELTQRLAAHRAELGLLPADEDDEDGDGEPDAWFGFEGEEVDGDGHASSSIGAKGGAVKKAGLWEVNEYEDDEKTVSVEVSEM